MLVTLQIHSGVNRSLIPSSQANLKKLKTRHGVTKKSLFKVIFSVQCTFTCYSFYPLFSKKIDSKPSDVWTVHITFFIFYVNTVFKSLTN